jgi:hypothetical protein
MISITFTRWKSAVQIRDRLPVSFRGYLTSNPFFISDTILPLCTCTSPESIILVGKKICSVYDSLSPNNSSKTEHICENYSGIQPSTGAEW